MAPELAYMPYVIWAVVALTVISMIAKLYRALRPASRHRTSVGEARGMFEMIGLPPILSWPLMAILFILKKGFPTKFNAEAFEFDVGDMAASASTGRETIYEADRVQYRTTLGYRILITPLTALIVYFVHTLPFGYGLTLIAGILGCFYVWDAWVYRLTVTRDQINCPDWLNRDRIFLLSDYEGLTNRDNGRATLHFKGGRQVSILRYLDGWAELQERLASSRHMSERPECPNSPKSKPSAADLPPLWKVQ